MGPWLSAMGWVSSALAGMPLREVAYEVEVDGPLAEIHLSQVFVNDSASTIEAIYVFPLHEEAAVDGMKMIVGGHLIEGEILERDQAKLEYAEALDQGYVAALTLEERPNLFTQYVGNIPPGEEIIVELRVVQPVPHVDGAYELVLPLVAAPRFVSPEEWSTQSAQAGPIFEGPPVSLGGTGVTAGIDVEVDSGLPFEFMVSPSHDVAISEISKGVHAATGRTPLDRDFVLRWGLSAAHPEATLHVQDSHMLLTIEPPSAPARTQVVPREFIWVIDQSCSMSGAPIELVRSAMLEALTYMDARDSLRILTFSDKVRGDAVSQPATPSVLAKAKQTILDLKTEGGTYLLDGVLAALDSPLDPHRERTILFLTDALISNDTAVLRAISDKVGGARLFAFGVSAAPNRWLLDEMARFGGGKTSWLRPGEPPQDAVARFMETIAQPMLSEIKVDYGDWEVEETWPMRIPALYAGQPLNIVGRIVKQGTSDITVSGRMGDSAYTTHISPIDAGPGRAIPSTWARQKIANLERDQIWGVIPELEDEILETSLSYQVLSKSTAFLAVDRGRIVNRGGPNPGSVQPVDAPAGSDWPSGDYSESIEVTARRLPIESESTSTGQVASSEFLHRIPAGRTYQTAVQIAPGVTGGGGGNPTLIGGAGNENTYLLDGANITDPVTGTFSLNFNVDAISQIELVTAGRMPEDATSTGLLAKASTESGTNNLEMTLQARHMSRLGSEEALAADHLSGQLSGPLVRDKLWMIGSYGFDHSSFEEAPRDFLGHTGFLKLTAQPNPEHRFHVSGAGELSEVTLAGVPTRQQGALGLAKWQWFLSPWVNTETTASGQVEQFGSDVRRRLQAKSNLSALGTDDPLWGTHDLKGGVDVERVDWILSGDWASDWLGVETQSADGVLRSGFFLQDSYKPISNLTLNGGARVDVALGRAHVGPSLYGAWDPWGDQKTKLVVGLGRVYGGIGLPVSVVSPELGLARLDEGLVVLERELVSDIAFGVEAVLQNRYDIPVYGGSRADLSAWATRLFLRKIESRRWSADLSWRYAQLLFLTPGAVPLTGFEDELLGFQHAVEGAGFWNLPTDPWTTSVGLVGRGYFDPLFATALDPSNPMALGGPSYSGGVRLSQRFDLRKGGLSVDMELLYLSVLDRSPSPVQQMQTPLLVTPGWGGPRLDVGLRYDF